MTTGTPNYHIFLMHPYMSTLTHSPSHTLPTASASNVSSDSEDEEEQNGPIIIKPLTTLSQPPEVSCVPLVVGIHPFSSIYYDVIGVKSVWLWDRL